MWNLGLCILICYVYTHKDVYTVKNKDVVGFPDYTFLKIIFEINFLY